ncbi:hypothetical protein BJ684DRAFT_18999 [Piptocephalis cylindrospora]|uniref:MMS19 nucleotide excision repair protein n=1 Tax=Piptocephalis cylindrospora TaxID=1907219 RepID=A0A4P9Y7B0_9FUNG|nr:hypothetical protein BJ684DRAFT_18999 [Piptocephalis cylindrospora]|eukprot:RKP14604.1 hypothetical protein BJ684DRAFT_18999 [Piptocephalis cylindrospora]
MSTQLPDFLPPLIQAALSSTSSPQDASEAKDDLTTRVQKAILPLSTLFLALAPDMTSESATSRLHALRLLNHLLPSCPSLNPSGGDVILRFVASRLSPPTPHVSVPEILALGEVATNVLDLGRTPRSSPSCSASGIENLLTQFLPGVLEEAGREEGRTPDESRMARHLLRSLSYRLLQSLSTGPYVESYALAHPKVLGSALQEASEGERDPQGLILLFQLTSTLLPILDQTPWVQGDAEVASNLFDIPFRYFPITFRSPIRPGAPATGSGGGTGQESGVEEEVREALAQALYALAPTPTLGPLMYTSIVEKASASSWACRRDVWRVLRGAGGDNSVDDDPSSGVGKEETRTTSPRRIIIPAWVITKVWPSFLGDVLLINCPPGSEGGKEARVSLLQQCLPLLGILLHSLFPIQASEEGEEEMKELEEKINEISRALLDREMTPLALAEPLIRVLLVDVPRLQGAGEPDGSEALGRMWFSRIVKAAMSSQGSANPLPLFPRGGETQKMAMAHRSRALLALSLLILGKRTGAAGKAELFMPTPLFSSYSSSQDGWYSLIIHGLLGESNPEEGDENEETNKEEEYILQALGCLVAGSQSEGGKALEGLVGLITGEVEGLSTGPTRRLRQKGRALRVLSEWLDQGQDQKGPEEAKRKQYAVSHLLPLLVGGAEQPEEQNTQGEEEDVRVYYPLLIVSPELLKAFLDSSFPWLTKSGSSNGGAYRGKEVWCGLFDALLQSWGSQRLDGARGGWKGAKARDQITEDMVKMKGQRMGKVVYDRAFLPLIHLISENHKADQPDHSITRGMGHVLARVSSFLSLTIPDCLQAWIQESSSLQECPEAHLIFEAILVGSPPLSYMGSEERIRIIRNFQDHLGEDPTWDAWVVAAMVNKYPKDAEPLHLSPGDRVEAQALYLRAIPTNQVNTSPHLSHLLTALMNGPDSMQEQEEKVLIQAILITLLNPPSYPNLFYKGDGSIRRPLQHQRIRSTLITRLVEALEANPSPARQSPATYHVFETILLSKAPNNGSIERGRGPKLDPVLPWDRVIRVLTPAMKITTNQSNPPSSIMEEMIEKARWGAIRVIRDGILRLTGLGSKETFSDPESLTMLLKTFLLSCLHEASPRVRLEALSGLLDVLRRVRESSVRGTRSSSLNKGQSMLRDTLKEDGLRQDVETLRDDPHRAVRRRVVLVLSLLREL